MRTPIHTEKEANAAIRHTTFGGQASVSLTLPAPPSTNKLFRNVPGKGRVKTGEYKAWRDRAGWELRLQQPGKIAGRVAIIINIERASALSDIDNRIKALLDLLVSQRVIKDDRFVTALATAWAPPRADLAHVVITPAQPLTLNLATADDGATGGWFLKAPETEGPAIYGH